MRVFKHSPHPVDLGDYLFGRYQDLGGEDFDAEEESKELPSEERRAPLASAVNRLRRSVSERLFSIELRDIDF
jgi:hypothetical protein